MNKCLSLQNYKFEYFRQMCILSGCDYPDSIPGIGIKRALAFMKEVARLKMEILEVFALFFLARNWGIGLLLWYLVWLKTKETMFTLNYFYCCLWQAIPLIGNMIRVKVSLPQSCVEKFAELNWYLIELNWHLNTSPLLIQPQGRKFVWNLCRWDLHLTCILFQPSVIVLTDKNKVRIFLRRGAPLRNGIKR